MLSLQPLQPDFSGPNGRHLPASLTGLFRSQGTDADVNERSDLLSRVSQPSISPPLSNESLSSGPNSLMGIPSSWRSSMLSFLRPGMIVYSSPVTDDARFLRPCEPPRLFVEISGLEEYYGLSLQVQEDLSRNSSREVIDESMSSMRSPEPSLPSSPVPCAVENLPLVVEPKIGNLFVCISSLNELYLSIYLSFFLFFVRSFVLSSSSLCMCSCI